MNSSRKSTILLVEDDEDARKVISKIITDYGKYSVVEVSSAEEAISLYDSEKYQFDALIVDLVLPGKSGGDLAKYNFENKQLPIIVVTAFADANLALKLFEYGVEDYVLKPMESWQFSGILINALSRKALNSDVESDKNPFIGNIANLQVVSRMSELGRANHWLASMVKDVMSKKERTKFMNTLGEFLLNAHEHGNLNFSEELKSKLLEDNHFDLEMGLRESSCNKTIDVRIAAIRGQVAVYISDEGEGFDYEKYLNMTEEEILERADMLNGRGIILGRAYFDRIKYWNNGSAVMLLKNVDPA
jgi:CheY-like chemotaxis protein